MLEIEENKVYATEFIGNRQIVRTSTYNPEVCFLILFHVIFFLGVEQTEDYQKI